MIEETLIPGPAVALAGLLDRPSEEIDDGWALPDLWHWVYLLERPAQADLGPEGHPAHGIPEPPAPGLRRMFAGGRVSTQHRLRLGAPASRSIEVTGSRTRSGRSGKLTILTTRSTLSQDGRVAIVDEQDIIYREPTALTVAESESAPSPASGESDAEPAGEIDVDTTLLFRFSALTYNAHRIHYDRDWCRAEDYDNLVVHGTLQALLMAEAAERRAPRATSAFSYRLVSPLTLGQGLYVTATPDGESTATTVCDGAGRVTARGARRAAS